MDKLAAMSTFVKVVESGSFTRAANALDLPKARVSQRVSSLEDALGVRLLQRTTRVVKPTDDGRVYFARCQAILQEIEELEGSLAGDMQSPSGMVRVEALASIGRWVLAPRLGELRRRHPGLQVRLGSNDRISHLLEEGVDCAVRGGHLEDSSLVARHVRDVAFGLYAAPGYLAGFGPVGGLEDLRRAERLSWSGSRSGTELAWRLLTPGGTAELAEAAPLMFDDPDAAVEAALHGAGIVPAAPFAVATHVAQGRLAPVLPDWHFPPRPIHIVYPTSKHLSVRVRSFVQWALETLQASPQLGWMPSDLARSMERA